MPLVLTKADNHFRAHDARRGENIDDFQAARFGRAGGVQTNSKEGAIASALQTFVEQYSAASLSLLPRTLDAPGGASSVVPMRSGGAVGFGTRSPYSGSLSKPESSPGSNSPSHSLLASSPLPPNSSEIPTSFRPFSDRFSSPTKKKWEPESVRVLTGG